MGNAINAKSKRLTIPVIVDDVEIALIRVNPYSPLILRDLANIMRLFNPELLKELDDIPDVGEFEGNLETIEQFSAPLTMVGDFIDRLIAACDKIFGVGVTERILEDDDETMSLLKEVFDTVAREVTDSRKALTDKYRAQ